MQIIYIIIMIGEITSDNCQFSLKSLMSESEEVTFKIVEKTSKLIVYESKIVHNFGETLKGEFLNNGQTLEFVLIFNDKSSIKLTQVENPKKIKFVFTKKTFEYIPIKKTLVKLSEKIIKNKSSHSKNYLFDKDLELMNVYKEQEVLTTEMSNLYIKKKKVKIIEDDEEQDKCLPIVTNIIITKKSESQEEEIILQEDPIKDEENYFEEINDFESLKKCLSAIHKSDRIISSQIKQMQKKMEVIEENQKKTKRDLQNVTKDLQNVTEDLKNVTKDLKNLTKSQEKLWDEVYYLKIEISPLKFRRIIETMMKKEYLKEYHIPFIFSKEITIFGELCKMLFIDGNDFYHKEEYREFHRKLQESGQTMISLKNDCESIISMYQDFNSNIIHSCYQDNEILYLGDGNEKLLNAINFINKIV